MKTEVTTLVASLIAALSLFLTQLTEEPPPVEEPPPEVVLESATLNPIADATVRASEPDDNFSHWTIIRAGNKGSWEGYFKFDVAGVEGAVLEATLRLYASRGSEDTYSIFLAENEWEEETLTFNSKPSLYPDPVYTVNGVLVGEYVEFDVTQAVAEDGVYSFALVPEPEADDRIEVRSRRASDQPELVITYETFADPNGGEEPPVEEPELGVYVDDTHSCLSTYDGPLFDLSGDHGRNEYHLYGVGDSNLPEGSRFDAREGIWYQQAGYTPDNPRPIMLGSVSVNYSGSQTPNPLCIAGGVVIGTNDPDMDWKEAKNAPRGRALLTVSDRGTMDGMRVDNVGEDGVKPFVPRAQRAATDYYRHIIRNMWLSNIFDDAIEESQVQSMLVEDTLFDGVMQAVATDPAGGESDEYRGNLVTLNQVLIRTKPVLHPDRPTGYQHGFGLKMRIKTPHGWEFKDSVFAWDDSVVPHSSSFGSRLRHALQTVDSCSGNVIAWMGDTPFPSDVMIERDVPQEIDRLNAEFPGCFTILTGQEARDFWEGARANWINCHPKVGRIPAGASPAIPEGDPESDFSKCNANAYGGGGTDIQATISYID